MKVVIDSRFDNLSSFISEIPVLMESGQGDVVYDKRNKVVRFHHQGETLIVKRFKQVNIVQQLVYTFFRKSKAERAYLFAEEFGNRGIETPQRVAFMEDSRMGLFLTGYFVSKEAVGTETHLLLREVQDYDPLLAEAVAQQVVLLHSKGILHGDLNLSNFLCREDAEGYHFTMIDINRSKFCEGYPTDRQCLENLVRLTHRRDLYEDLVRRYATLRGWAADDTARRALSLLDRFENRKFRLIKLL